jgi:hypothetical protein
MKTLLIVFLILTTSIATYSREYHVAKNGNNKNEGSKESPLLTIQMASNLSLPGDVVIVHEGTYRECVVPPRGGKSNEKRITYQAASGEKVIIKGSEEVKNWQLVSGKVWKAVLTNDFFGNYNPYRDTIHGDWFDNKGRVHHTGDVYLNGKSLWEVESLEKVKNPVAVAGNSDEAGSLLTWYCETDERYTTIYANFQGVNPMNELVEINVRKSCFYPNINFVNYITINGFTMCHAATQWAPPTAEQVGLIGTNWSKGWIIENNIISDSRCSGITLGKHGDEFDNTSENSAEGYVKTIERAYKRGWNKETIGSHIVRNNTIFNCEQTGICGSMGAVFSTIENNNIYNIWKKRQFTGAEMGGIKIHASIDMVIAGNRLYNCGRGLWLDWMAQGTRVTRNLFYNNTTDDVFVEVNHGPFLIDNNILLSPLAIRDWSEGGAYVHNLIAGNIELRPQDRETPFHEAHSTKMTALAQTKGGDNRYFNNIFVGGKNNGKNSKSGLGVYSTAGFPMIVNGNVYINGAEKSEIDRNLLELQVNPEITVTENDKGVYLNFLFPKEIMALKNSSITTSTLGRATVSGQPFENPDGSGIIISTDYFGKKRNKNNPTAGPFEKPDKGNNKLKVW